MPPAAIDRVKALPVFIVLFIILSIRTYGQKGIWDNAGKLRDHATRQAGRTTGGLKKWKDHLQTWGLDTNYNHAFSLGGKLLTNGWSFQLQYQAPVGSPYDRRKGKHAGLSECFTLSFSEVKHEKQVKQQKEHTAHPELGASRPFVFGKINNLYLLQLGYGRERLLLPGVLEGNIAVSFRYSAGFSLAMLKPYYLKLMYITYTPDPVITLKEEKYGDLNRALFLERDKIFGGSGWSKGLDEIDYVPGVFVDGAFVVEPAKRKGFIQTVTFGGQLSAYAKKLPIMAERKAYPYMGALYVGLSLGKRWK